MKKILCLFLALLLTVFFVGCSKTENTVSDIVSDEKTTIQDLVNEEKVAEKTDDKTLLSDLTATVFSQYNGEFKDMRFGDYIQSKITPTDKGTSFTIVVHSNNQYDMNNIESVTVKSLAGGAVNFKTKTFILNNNKGIIVFAKTEGDHKYKDYSLLIKTYSNETKLIPIAAETDKGTAEQIVTESSVATFGDIVSIQDHLYFIAQSGQFNASTHASDNINTLEYTTATIFVPLSITYQNSLNAEDFYTKFYDNNNLGNYNIKSEIAVNDANIMSTYLNEHYSDLFVESINCIFTHTYTKDKNAAIAERDYVVKNTFIKTKSNDDFSLVP